MLNQRKGIAMISMVSIIVAGIIGAVIVDDITADSRVPEAFANESFINDTTPITAGDLYRVSNRRGYLLGTTTLKNGTGGDVIDYALTANYTELNTTHINVTDANTALHGTTFLLSYDGPDSVYFSSATSRTIANFLVPIILIGFITLAVLVTT